MRACTFCSAMLGSVPSKMGWRAFSMASCTDSMGRMRRGTPNVAASSSESDTLPSDE